MARTIKRRNVNIQFSLMYLLTFYVLIMSYNVFGSDRFSSNNIIDIAGAVDDFIAIENKYTFYGLASYYNNINYYVVNRNVINKIDVDKVILLKEKEWLIIGGRLNVLSIQAPGAAVHFDGSKLSINSEITSTRAIIRKVAKSELSSITQELDQIRYIHLWKPLAWLAKFIESILVYIQENIYSNWGWTIVIFSVLLKLILLPIGVMTVVFQRKVSQIQTKLAPKFVEIKASFDGEEAHNLLMSTYKEHGVSPFYTLKPMLGSFIEIPILISVFNTLGEMPQLDGKSFLWIDNLAYPDALIHVLFDIPMFGNTINFLPLFMTVVTLFTAVIFKNRYALESEIKRKKYYLYFIAIAFLVLFYPFPAAMVLYWTAANILQVIQQQFVKI